jgi:hypothetical protein
MSYKNPTVQEVMRNVREGIRTKKDLEVCGCSICREALRRLERIEKERFRGHPSDDCHTFD